MSAAISIKPLALPDYRAQVPEVAARFAKIKQRPVILQVDKLGKMFTTRAGTCTAIGEISFSVHRREFVCVIGPSGCGKSTLIRIIAGLDYQTSGQMLLDGKPVSGPGSDRGMVFQGYTLFPWLTVPDYVARHIIGLLFPARICALKRGKALYPGALASPPGT